MKEIWLPETKTHVTIEDGNIRIWDSMVMTSQKLNKKSIGFDEQKEEKE